MDTRPLNPTLAALRGNDVAPESFWRSLHYYHFYRFIVASLFFLASGYAGVVAPFGSQNPLLAKWLSAAYLALSILIPAGVSRWRPRFNLLLTTEVVTDIVVLTLLMYVSGGNHSGLDYMLLVVLAAAALVGQGRLSLFYAALATVAVLLEQSYRALHSATDIVDFTHTGIISIGFFATAITARLLAKRVVENEILAHERGIELANQLQINQRVIRELLDGVLVVDADGRVRQHNQRAALLCECLPPDEPSLGDFSAEIAQRYLVWRKSKTEVVETIRVPRSGRSLKIRFLPASESENALIYLEDVERVQAQAQQIKLVALGRLTANIAHEIRNPLASISYAAELLTDEHDITTQARLTTIIGDNAQRLNRLVTDVLELGRRDRAQPELIKVGEFVRALIDEICVVNPKARGCIVSECDTSIQIRFDHGHLARIVSNLIENALRYCSGADRSIIIRVEMNAFSKRIDISVIDDGSGIGSDTRNQIFEPFFTTRGNGTGLGLYIARELCEANDGSIELVNTLQGTHFRVSGRGE